MCSVWKQKRDKELTPDEFGLILNDPLFSNLKHVGVSGGEPTMRKDLPEIFRILVQKRPRIKGTGIITNAFQKDKVIDRILASAEICKEAGMPFNVMISLDGIGEVHNRIRGREGIFESAVEAIRYFRDNTDIPISIGCTITKDNVWHVDEVLDFCKNEGVHCRFRVAEFIQRLYNDQQGEYIRNFSEREAYHLGLFFAKLEYTYEKNPKIKKTYRNIRHMLMENSGRLIGCPYQSNAVTLGSGGQLLYCAPKSPVLGSCLEESAYKLYLENIETREQIKRDYCSNCIHDYHSDEIFEELWSELKDLFWRWRMSLNISLMETRINKISNFARIKKDSRNFLIIGWYGTETTGDKAILGEIIYRIQNKHPSSKITLASLYPYVSNRTVEELGHPDIEVIPTYSAEFWEYIKTVDEVVMGGGPLMHIGTLGTVLQAFFRAKRSNHRTRILGCGIGPLDRGKKYQEAVKRILMLADDIELRDSASVTLAKNMTGRDDIVKGEDPAVGFVQRWKDEHKMPEPSPVLNLYLRDWTREYQGDLKDQQFDEIKERFEKQLGEWIHEICNMLSIRPRLLPMHNFCIGNDDRDFNRRFADAYLSDLNPIVEGDIFTVEEILTTMQESTLSLCMRFHSVLFANTLDAPFFAIDYTHGGKIASYLKDQNRTDCLVGLDEIADGKWKPTLSKIEKLIEKGQH